MCGGIKGLGRTWIGDQGEEVPLITLFTGDFFYNNRVGSSLRAQEFGREIKILVGKKKKKKTAARYRTLSLRFLFPDIGDKVVSHPFGRLPTEISDIILGQLSHEPL